MELKQLLKEYAPGMNFPLTDEFHTSIANIYSHEPTLVEQYIKNVYGEEKFKELIKDYMDSLDKFIEKNNQKKPDRDGKC
jgi:hypothetical protein